MKVISLFCGCGGLDLGFVRAGHEVVWASDYDKDSIETFNSYKELGGHAVCEDIYKVKIKDIPDGDIVIGGFPCQGFSLANPYRNTTDERNKLYLQLLRIIKGKKPKLFLAENVQGIMSLAKGAVFNMILSDFKEAGYNVTHAVLNSANYGVPQFRKRVIFLGIRKDIKISINLPPPITHVENPELPLFSEQNLKRWKTLGEAIGDLPEPGNDSGYYNHIGTKHRVKINGFIGNRATKSDRPSPTIVGRGGGTGGPVIIPHPNLKRRLTPRECARLQDFPDEFVFKGAISSQYRQIGNAVPVGMAYNIAKIIPKKINVKGK